MAPYPEWLHILAWTYISVCLACALGLAIHTLIRPQKMAIMSLVWPITALYMGPVAIALYLRSLPVSQKEPTSTSAQMREAMERTKDLPPTPLQNAIAVFHCGAGCSIGDLIAESIVPTLGLIFAGEFGSKLILDFVFAYIFGIVFQYATSASSSSTPRLHRCAASPLAKESSPPSGPTPFPSRSSKSACSAGWRLRISCSSRNRISIPAWRFSGS
jgi:hypothetical protein